MVIVRLVGGLGNQMFQYAYAKALEDRGYVVKIDSYTVDMHQLHGGYQLGEYNIDLPVSTRAESARYHTNNLIFKILRRLNFSKIVTEKKLSFDEAYLNVRDGSYIIGYFQSEKYFKSIRETLLQQFSLTGDMSNYAQIIVSRILRSNNSCSIHVRRGDYLSEKNISFHGFCSLDYYKDAAQYMQEKEGDLIFFIFSDDVAWTRENLRMDHAVYVEDSEKRRPHEDMYLMSLCNHHIIANSSFSWWGAWLSRNKNKTVIAPRKWFADSCKNEQSDDIINSNWVRL